MTNKIFRKILGFSVLALAAVAVSCVKEQELEYAPALPRISFRPGLLNVDVSGPGTRASDADSAPREEVVVLSGEDSSFQPLYLHISASTREDYEQDGVPTRAGDGGGLLGYDSFGVYGFSYRESETIDSAAPIMSDVEVSEETSATGSWAPSSGDYRWPGSGRMVRFYAYAPYNASGIDAPASATAVPPSLIYAVPSTPDAQTDLLAGSSEELSGDGTTTSASVSFSHALTGIRFVVGDDMMEGTVVSIAIKNVYGSATLTPGATTLWSRHARASTYAQDIEFEVNAGTRGAQMGKTLYLLPQTLPSGAVVEVSFIDNVLSLQSTFSASLAGKTWNAGELITFSVSTSSIKTTPVINLSKSSVNFQYTGGTDKYTIESYNLITGLGNQQIKVPVDYTVEYYGYNEATGAYDVKLPDKPEWLTEFGGDGKGTTSAKEFNIACGPQTAVEKNEHTDSLRAASPKGSKAKPYDLSMYRIDGTSRASGMTTANCYVVSAPGWYCFPLVYGNAITSGKTNKNAFATNLSPSLSMVQDKYKLKEFVNHTGNAITSPFLSENEGVTPVIMELLWNDTGKERYVAVEPTLIEKNVVVDGNFTSVKYAVFNVPQETIMQGNAVIAVKDGSGTILWSWHIWITDFVFSKNFFVLNGVKAYYYAGSSTLQSRDVALQMAKFPALGYCDPVKAIYSTRRCMVSFAVGGTHMRSLYINQNETSVFIKPQNAPLYQWGRKDPSVPIIYKNSNCEEKESYITSSQSFSYVSDTAMELCETIKSPTCFGDFNRYSVLWSTAGYVYRANAGNFSSAPLYKAVYDPCPPGTSVFGFHGFADRSAYTVSYISTSLLPLAGVILSNSNDEINLPYLPFRVNGVARFASYIYGWGDYFTSSYVNTYAKPNIGYGGSNSGVYGRVSPSSSGSNCDSSNMMYPVFFSYTSYDQL